MVCREVASLFPRNVKGVTEKREEHVSIPMSEREAASHELTGTKELRLSYLHVANKSHVDTTTTNFSSRGCNVTYFSQLGNIVLAFDSLLDWFPLSIAHVQQQSKFP